MSETMKTVVVIAVAYTAAAVVSNIAGNLTLKALNKKYHA